MKTIFIPQARYDRIKQLNPAWVPRKDIKIVVVKRSVWEFPFFAAMAIIIFVHAVFAVLVLGNLKKF